MIKLSEHFSREEFSCKCGCGLDTVDVALLPILEDLRTHFGHPIIITSGCRCWLKNHSVGGSDQSQHIIGRAVDLKMTSISAEIVADYLLFKYPDSYGIGRYDTWTHIDTRNVKARWDERHS